MEHGIQSLPFELQERLLKEIHSYGQLNHQQTAGMQYYLNHLCYKDITIGEFVNYMNQTQPQRVFIYIETDFEFIVLDASKMISLTYLIEATVVDKMTLNINTQVINSYDLYIHLPGAKVTFDLLTTYHIYNKRPYCIDSKLFLTNQYRNNISMNTCLNKIKTSYYIFSNWLRIKNDHYGIYPITISLNRSIDNYANEIYNHYQPAVIDYLNNI